MNSGRLLRTPEIPALTRLRYLPRDACYCGDELVRVLKPAKERGLRRIG